MITVTITGEDAQEVAEQMKSLLSLPPGVQAMVEKMQSTLYTPPGPVAATAELTSPPQDSSKPKRGRPAKEKPEAKEPEPETAAVGAVPTPEATAAEPTPEELVKTMKDELMDLAKVRPGEPNEQAGWARVGAILSKYGYQRFTEIKPADYQAIIKEARIANGRATA